MWTRPAADPARRYLSRRSPGEPRLEQSRELTDHVPIPCARRLGESERERLFDVVYGLRFAWPKRDQLPRTYVNSRRLLRT
jgi:hypothetical protein